MKTYGTAKLVGDSWRIDCEPHVAVRIKRVFSKIRRNRGTILLSATEENCRDLEWFAERYPLDFDQPEEIARRARAYDSRVEHAIEILDGRAELPASTMALPPRRYQQQAAALVLNSGSLLLADELGLGKTVSAITVLENQATLPAVVVVPAHLPRQWKAEIERFLPFYYVHIAKKGTVYDVSHRGRAPDVLILSYHKLHGWSDHLAGRAKTVIFDECQELRTGRKRNDTSLKYAAAEQVAEKANYRMGLSATPIYNYGDEFFSVLNVLSPGCLGTKTEFVREWCVQYSDKHRISDPKAFGSYLRESALMVRRTRKDVARELPSLQRVVHELDIEAMARFGDAEADKLAELILSQQGGFVQMQARADFDMRLRQATGIQKAPYVADFVKILLEDGQPVILYGWHRAVYEIWASRFEKLEPAWYTGSESPAKKASEADRFITGKTKLMILSLRSGLGLDGLQKVCSRVVFGELDWSPGVLEQCVGRIHRDGQPNPVLAYYLTAPDGSDPVMVDVLDLKRSQLQGVKEPFGEVLIPKEVDPEHVKKLAQDYLARRGKQSK